MISCPFLSKMSSFTIQKQTQRLLNNASKCPYMKKFEDIVNINSRDSSQNIEKPKECIDAKQKEETEFQAKNQNKFDFSDFFRQKIKSRKDESTYRVFKRILRDSKDFPFAYDYSSSKKPKKITVWCSNDYLGMTRHPHVVEQTIKSINKYGSGSGGTRNISGNTVLHEELETELADFHHKDASLVFSSCFVANEAALYTLGQNIPNLEYISDAGNHASMIHGIRTSLASKQIFKHNDPLDLERVISRSTINKPKIVVFETVHSMSGQICPLKEFLDISHKHDAFTFVDEVHAIGLYGNEGAGVAQEHGLDSRIDVISGTLGKAVGCVGGYIAGSKEMVDMIRNYAAGFIFTTSLPPSTMAGALASLQILRSSEGVQLRQILRDNVELLRKYLHQEGIPILQGSSHIIPVLVGDAEICTNISNTLLEDYDIYVQAINYPTVKKGESRLRVSITPYHDKELICQFVDSLVKVWNKYNLPKLDEKMKNIS